jgi:hypothetical protein
MMQFANQCGRDLRCAIAECRFVTMVCTAKKSFLKNRFFVLKNAGADLSYKLAGGCRLL